MIIDMFAKQSMLLAINCGYERVIRKINADLKKDGCNFLQSLILIAILFEKKSVTPSNLAKTFMTSKSNISHAISTLEKNKFVVRESNESDSRKWEISLTSKGQKIVNKLVKKIEHYENEFEDAIGKTQGEELINNLNVIFKVTDQIT